MTDNGKTFVLGVGAQKVFKSIQDGFERRGVTLKVIFLMRDPIQRCWSAVRMRRRNARAAGNVTMDVVAL